MKVNTILVPTDFSTYANNALNAAVKIAQKTDALVKVYYNSKLPMPMEEMRPELKEFYQEYFTEELMAQEQMFAIRANPMLAGIQMQFEIGYGHLMANIIEKVKKEAVDLIVMGTHGQDKLDDYLIGSTTLKILRMAECAVLTVKETIDPFEFNNVIFASDFKKEALSALKDLVDFTEPYGSTIHLLNIDVNNKFVETPALFKQSIADFTQVCGERLGIAYSYQQMKIGEGIEQIKQVYDADLIAIGTHYREYNNNMYSSFITESVIHITDAPVMTIQVGIAPEDLDL